MSEGARFTCKECGASGPYEEMPKGLDPRPDVFRVICRNCIDGIKTASHRKMEFAPHQRGSQSSRDGAQKARSKSATQALEVLRHLRDAGERGLTCEQVMQRTGYPVNEATRALNGLWSKDGTARKADFRRPSRAGVMVQVYQITEIGRQAL